MIRKKRVKELEEALRLGKNPEECNDPELRSLLDMNDLVKKHVHNEQEPSADFKEQLRESIAFKRTEKKNNMKFPKLSFPTMHLSLSQRRWSAITASALLFAFVVTMSGLFPFGGSQLGKFNRLILNEAYAQTNFEITPSDGDTTGVASTSGFTITSIELISLEDLQDNIRISPETDFTLTSIDDHTFFLQPLTELLDGNVYTVTIDSAYLTTAGQLNTRDYSWAFQVEEPFKVLHTIPRDLASGVPTDTGIEFTFSHQNVINIDEAFSISPHVDGRFETYGRTIVFVPSGNLDKSTIYSVSLDDTVKVEGSDRELLKPVSFQFETSNNTSQARFNVSETMLEFAEGDQLVIPVWAHRDFGQDVAAKVYAFQSTDQYIEALNERLAIPAWARASRANHKIDASNLSEISTSELSIEEIDGKNFVILSDELTSGFYLIELSDKQVLLQVTDLAVYTAITATDTIIWVNDTATREVVAGAHVMSLDGRLDARTDADGIVVFEEEDVLQGLDNPYNISDFLTVTYGDKQTVVQLGRSTDYYYYRNPYQSDEYWNYLYTDRSMYRPTDTVQFWGFVKERDGAFPDNVRVTLSSRNYYSYRGDSVPLYSKTLPIEFGAFEDEVSFSNLTQGSYVLDVFEDEVLIDSRYISVREFDKPAYELSIESEHDAVFAGESFAYNVEASFFEGTPVSRLDIDGTSRVSSSKVDLTLDENGETSFTMKTSTHPCSLSGKSCPLVNSGTLELHPQLGEEGEISATARQIVFNSRIFAELSTERSDSNLISATMNTFYVDLDKFNEFGGRYYYSDDYLGSVAGNVSVQAQITEVSYTKTQTGEVYDFINKVHRPQYSFSTQKKVVDTFTATTDENGYLTVSYQGDEDKSYIFDFLIEDGKGGQYKTATNSNAPSRYQSQYNYEYVGIERVKNEGTFKIGELAEFVFEKNNDEIVPDADDAFLFLKLKQGLVDHKVTQDARYSFIFSEDEVPNVHIDGVYFDGVSYSTAEYSFFSGGVTAQFDTSDRALEIQIETDKDAYEPGENVQLNIQVRDANGQPVRSSVNVNLVDEAFYALRNETVNPLASLYQNVGSGLVSVNETHKYRSISAFAGGAEGGGCFLENTQILMADGSTKSIEEIVVGDKILTRQSEQSNVLIAATVKQTFVHDVNEYMILNDKIRVTPEHRMFVNYGWQQIGDAKVGDVLVDADGSLVRIDSIEWVREPVTVYNFEVEGLHTYFADGVYVHNDKGGEREDFADTALFESVITDANGNATLSFELPDNITSWRVTAQGVSPNLQAGDGVTPVLVTKPVFTDAVIASEYLVSDKPEIKVRAYGTALEGGDSLAFNVSSDTLGIDESFTGEAYVPAYISLGDLSGKSGSHDVLVSVETDEYTDVIKQPLSVVETRVSETEEILETLTVETTLTNKANEDLLFTDATRGQYYADTRRIAFEGGGRVDREAAQIIGRNLLSDYFADTRLEANIELTPFTAPNGMISLLPYSEGELALTAKIAVADPSLVDSYTLTSKFYEILDSRDSTNEEISQALLGLAALDEPVLIPIQNLAGLEDQSVVTRLYTALALAEIGDRENARKVYFDLLRDYGEENDAYTRLKVGSDAETLEMTALATVVAAKVQDPNMDKLWAYTSKVYEKNVITPLERALYLSIVIPQLPESDSSFVIEVNGDQTEIDLSNGRTFRLRLTEDQAATASITSVNGAVDLVTSRSVRSEGTKQSDLLSIEREYRDLSGHQVTEMKEGDILEVLIKPSFSASAPDGAYLVTDLVPSGLSVISQPRRVSQVMQDKTSLRRPYAVKGQEAKFYYYNGLTNREFRYFVRVTSIGEYTAEPARIEHMETPSIHSFSDQEVVTVTR